MRYRYEVLFFSCGMVLITFISAVLLRNYLNTDCTAFVAIFSNKHNQIISPQHPKCEVNHPKSNPRDIRFII